MSVTGSALLALFLVQAAAPQQPPDKRPWDQAYTDGMRQFESGQWQAAIESLEIAKAGGPKPGRSIRLYGEVRDYLPDYYLGVAHANLKQFAEANTAFDAVRRSGLINPGDPEWGTLAAQSARAGFEVLMAQAAEAFESKAFDKAAQLWTQAKAFGLDTAEVDSFLDRVGRILADEKASIPAAKSDAPAVQVADTAQQRQEQQQTQPRAVPTAQPNAPRPNPVAVAPGQEQKAMAAFFSGEYQRAADLLSALTGRRASDRAVFYLACSRAALVEAGAAEPSTLVAARAQFASVDLTRFAADLRYISPRVLESLQATGAAP